MNRRIAILSGLLALAGSLALALAPMGRRDGPAVHQPLAAKSPPRAAASAATTQPSDQFALPPEYAVLQTRNAFSRDKGRGRSGGPEAMFVFKGAVKAGPTFTALIEDLAAKRVMQAVVGDAVARGRITSIDLDGVNYAAAGNTRRIAVGQDLEGKEVPPTPPAPPASQPSPDGTMATPPAGPGPLPGPRPRGSRQGAPPH